MKVIILSLMIVLVLANQDSEIINYLKNFGYLKSTNTSLIDLDEAILNFKEFYRLNSSDANITNEVVELIKKPRCSIPDNPYYQISAYRWKKNIIKWSFVLGRNIDKQIAKIAFETWANVSNLQFEYSNNKPDILISYKQFNHSNSNRCINGICHWPLDGKGMTLGHAYFPNRNSSCVEIHLDRSEKWNFDINKSSGTSLLSVLIHEIGHTLGLQHSGDQNSIMFPYYKESFILSNDDISGIEYLYGKQTSTEIINTTPLTTSRPTITSFNIKTDMDDDIDLCKIQYPDRMLITSNHHFYIFYKNLAWIMDLTSNIMMYKSINLKSYLKKNSQILHIYQKSNGDIIIIHNKDYFSILYFPSLSSKAGFQNRSIQNLGVQQDIKKLNAVFESYSGKTFVLYNNQFYIEIDDCTSRTLDQGLIVERFPGVPSDIDNVFRYTNGNLYFFRKGIYYEFNEFSNIVISASKFTWSKFGIQCPTESLLHQLKQLLSSVANYLKT